MQFGGEGERSCILCNSLDVKVKNRGGGDQLISQLRVIYLVERVFRRELQEGDSCLLKILQVLGNPEEWFGICVECGELVDRGMEIWRRLKRVEREHIRILGRLQGRVMTGGGEEDLGECNNDLGLLEVMGMRGAKRNVRRWLRGGLNVGNSNLLTDGEIEVKQEPATEPLEDGGVDGDGDEWVPPDDTADFGDDHLSLDGDGEEVPTPPVENRIVNDLPSQTSSSCEAKRQLRRHPRRRKFTVNGSDCSDDGDHDSDEDYEPVPVFNGVPVITSNKIADDDWEERANKLLKKRCVHRNPVSKKRKRTDKEIREEEERTDFYVPNPEEKESSEDEEEILLKTNIPLTDKVPRGKRRMATEDRRQFFTECPNYLDNTLIVYPPKTKEDLARIPKGGEPLKTTEDGEKFNGKGHRCPRCPKRFSRPYYAIAHIHRVHMQIEKPWRCPHCSYRHYSSNHFRWHVIDHLKGKLLICKVCGNYSSSSKKQMDSHVIDHQKGEAKPKCPDCEEVFRSFSQYTQHMTQEHGYWSKFSYARPMCDVCGLAFKSSTSLTFHKVRKHGEADKTGQFPVCDVCGVLCMKGQPLKRHKERYHPDSSQLFCEYCGKQCVNSIALAKHVKTWHVEEPQECQVCGMQQKNKAMMQSHLKRVHPETRKMSETELEKYKRKNEEEMAYSCKICGQRFAWKHLFYHHQRSSHPEITNKFRCDLCGKGFSRMCSVKRHKETEHEGKKAECQLCGNTFTGADGLTQHLRNRSCEVLKKQGAEQQQTQVVQGTFEQAAFEHGMF